MGALTNNRKRGEEFSTLNHGYAPLYSPDSGPQIDLHVSKKLRFSFLGPNLDQPVKSSKSAASLLSRYPEPTTRLSREVHAPCRIVRYGFLSIVRRESKGSGDFMGNMLHKQYNWAKSRALSSLRYLSKEKEVIDVEEEPEKDVGSDDSSIEEIGIEEHRREVEGGSVVSDQRCQEDNGIVANTQRPDLKVLESQIQPSCSTVTELVSDDMKVDNAEKMLDLLSLDREVDVPSVPLYEKLRESAERRNPKLSDLKFQIQLNESRRSSFNLLRPTKKPDEKAFIPLTKEEEDEVSHAFCAKRKTVLVTHENSSIEITGEIFQCLRPGAWLNDEIINVYLELLKEREKREPTKFLKCHFFSTFFYKKLISGRSGYDYKSVRRWTTQRRLGYSLMECDKIFVPIHKEIHWCLAVINLKDEKLQYLDSLKGVDTRVLKILARYIMDEVKDKCGKDIDVSCWKQEHVEDLPAQENGSDCGMFMIKYADFYSRDIGLCFKQENMPYFRLRTAKEILRLRAE